MVVNFNYQIQYELCSLLFLLCITVQFLAAKRFRTMHSNMFSLVLFVSIFDLVLDILGALAINNIDKVPVWLTFLPNALFYCVHTALPVIMLLYVLYSVGFDLRTQPPLLLLMVPAAMFLLIQIINPFTGLIFSIERTSEGLKYVSGPLSTGFYICSAFYLATSLVFLIKYRTKLTVKQFWTVLLFNIVIVGAMIYQMANPNLLLTGTAITVSIMLWDLTLQNPEDMVDEETGAYDEAALTLFLSKALKDGHIHAAVIEIDGLSTTDRGEWSVVNSMIMKQISVYFSKLTPGKSWLFRDGKTRFWLMARDEGELDRVSNAIVERFEDSWDVEGISVDLMVRVLFFSTMTSLSVSKEELLSIVDENIQAQRLMTQSRSRLVIDSNMLAKHRRHHILEESIRRTINTKDGLYVCYQPIISVNNPEKTIAELLLRYNDPNLGAVSPAEFMPLIERCGLSIFIDNFVVESACAFLSSHPEVDLLHVNLSASEFFSNPERRIAKIVSEKGVDPGRICFEITESAAANSPEILRTFMLSMIEKGFSFALDDYGTGYSNAFQVTRMPFKVVKIDKALLDGDERVSGFLAGITETFRDMGMETVVEGIETKPQMEKVKAIGVDYMQGFLFSPPLVDSDYMDYIHNEKKP